MSLSPDEAVHGADRESLWTLFRIVFGFSALSWSGLALMAQLEHHYVERDARLSRVAFADLMALAWMVPGPIGCNVAVQLGHVLRGRAGAWIAGVASVLPFFLVMTLLAIFYRTPIVYAAASQTLLHHLEVVLATLIAVTWYKQTRALIHGAVEWSVAVLGCVTLTYAHDPVAYVLLLGGAFTIGWWAGPPSPVRLKVDIERIEWLMLAGIVALIVLFSLPLSSTGARALLWPRLAGAGMTLFGGGFAALPVLKSLFVTSAVIVPERDFTLAFALSPLSPGPLLNVVPFLGYLIDGWRGAVIATLVLFVPSGCLIVLAQRHVPQLQAHPGFARGMRLLRAMTTAFLAIAVLKLAHRVPFQPMYLVTALFAGVSFVKLKWPAYVVYGTVAGVYGAWFVYETLSL